MPRKPEPILRNYSKAQIIKRIAANERTRYAVVEQIVDAYHKQIEEILAVQGQRIEIRGFGIWSTRTRAARKARNPRTNMPMDVPEKRIVQFKVSSLLNERVMATRAELPPHPLLPSLPPAPPPPRGY